MNIVILCGGTGTRLWPLSRTTKPKQFNAVVSDQTMIEDTYERFTKAFTKEQIYFSTTKEQEQGIKEIFPDVDDDHIIVEPQKRDSGPAMGYVSAYLSRTQPDEPMAFIPCDHYIFNTDLFIENIKTAEQVIKKTGKMMDIAITPTFPSTALGYTHIGERSEESTDSTEIFTFRGHVEKPEQEKAKELLETKEYLWHANFYMWTPAKFLEAYKQNAPVLYQHLEEIMEAWEVKDQQKVEEAYGKMEKISIDYAVTEKMDPKDVLIIEGKFGWSDIGTWDVLYDKMEHQYDEAKNLTKGEVQTIDAEKNVIYNMNKKGKIVTAVGVKDLVIVDTEDATIVCDKQRTQDVKKLVTALEEQGKQQYL